MREDTQITDELYDYALRHSIPDDDVTRDLEAETIEALPDRAGMQVGGEQGRLLYLLVKLMGARRILEVGTFTGMSSLWMARALPPEGRVLCLDVSEEYTQVARRYWERAGVASRVELRLGPALESLRTLPATPAFDLAFIDADKENYPSYLDEVVPRLEPGGLLVADNTLWKGRLIDPDDTAASTEAIRGFNTRAASHPELETLILPLADGMTLARKRD